MKRITATVTAIVLLFGLAACSANRNTFDGQACGDLLRRAEEIGTNSDTGEAYARIERTLSYYDDEIEDTLLAAQWKIASDAGMFIQFGEVSLKDPEFTSWVAKSEATQEKCKDMGYKPATY